MGENIISLSVTGKMWDIFYPNSFQQSPQRLFLCGEKFLLYIKVKIICFVLFNLTHFCLKYFGAQRKPPTASSPAVLQLPWLIWVVDTSGQASPKLSFYFS